MNIGFIGLGHMGLPMASNLLKAGHKVTGFDVSIKAMEDFAAAGGLVTDSIQKVCLNQNLIITMLQTSDQVTEVCLGSSGFYPRASNLIHIDCSTIDPDTTRMLAKAAQEHNIVMLDAPVSGGVRGATKASLTFMVGGLKHSLVKIEPILAAMGKKIIYTGEHGSGQIAKLCNNMVLGVSMIAVAEAFNMAIKLGLDASKLFEVMMHSSGHCWALEHMVPYPDLVDEAPANHDFAPAFQATMMLKDLNLYTLSAGAHNLYAPLGEHAALLYQNMIDKNLGHLDFSGIIKLWN